MYKNELESNRVEQLNDKSLSSNPPTFLSSRPAPTLTLPRREGKRVAFTLAEVLITLGIIGVVAALTLPTLIQNYKEKQTVAQLKKSYSVINNAYRLALNEYGPYSGWFKTASTTETDENGVSVWTEVAQNNADTLFDKFVPFLNVSSRCKAIDSECKKYESIQSLTGKQTPTNVISKRPIINLSDGTTLYGGWIAKTSDCNSAKMYCADFSIDINGINRGPNAHGKDIFSFYLSAETIQPLGLPNDPNNIKMATHCNLNSTLNITTNGYACTAWVLQNENMDYLHCNDLNWNGKTRCK